MTYPVKKDGALTLKQYATRCHIADRDPDTSLFPIVHETETQIKANISTYYILTFSAIKRHIYFQMLL